MTQKLLKALLLEGAPDKTAKKDARKAMQHYSYTTWAFNLIHFMNNSRIGTSKQSDLVVDNSFSFYEHELKYFKKHGEFPARRNKK